MSIYAVGDLQGCIDPLKRLLDRVSFDPKNDILWSVGDLVNRGPNSLEVLRFCYSLGKSFRMVLGNHDLHLLAAAKGFRAPSSSDTLDEVLKAPDRDELLHWLQQQPLIIEAAGYVMVHAGIPPQWSLPQTHLLANEVEQALQCEQQSTKFFSTMYGDEPNCWTANILPPMRWRLITNYLTRMRFCSPKGELEFNSKGNPEKPPKGYAPWFQHPDRLTNKTPIIFGHWAALEGRSCGKNLFPLDTGYVWGGSMRLMNIKTQENFHQQA